jgi:hypothetical protein
MQNQIEQYKSSQSQISSYLQKQGDLSPTTSDKLSKVTLILENTNISMPDKYWFELYKNKKLAFKSRISIIDRPCWKNERCPMKLKASDDLVISVFRGGDVFDTFGVPNPIRDMDHNIFMGKAIRQIEITS